MDMAGGEKYVNGTPNTTSVLKHTKEASYVVHTYQCYTIQDCTGARLTEKPEVQ